MAAEASGASRIELMTLSAGNAELSLSGASDIEDNHYTGLLLRKVVSAGFVKFTERGYRDIIKAHFNDLQQHCCIWRVKILCYSCPITETLC